MSRAESATPSYDEPFLWWGPVWTPPPARTLVDLLRAGVLTPAVAALLWGALARRRSLVVAAGPRGVGKTTLLTALLDCLPPRTRRLYLRGCYETFAFLDDPAVVPGESVLLINELSAHLPAYLWGPGVRRVLRATQQGFAFAATAHATTIEDLIGQLAGYPLRIPLSELAAIELAVFMAPARGRHGERWQVSQVWSTAVDEHRGLTVDLIAEHGELRDVAAGGRGLPSTGEIARRAAFLAELAASDGALTQEQMWHVLGEYAD